MNITYAGVQSRDAAFEPLATLLLQPEALRHLKADSHDATSAGDGEKRSISMLSISSQVTFRKAWLDGQNCGSNDVCLH